MSRRKVDDSHSRRLDRKRHLMYEVKYIGKVELGAEQ